MHHTLAVRLLLPAFVLSSAGCATRPVSNADARSAPAAQVIDASYLKAGAGSGRVTVKRDSGIGGSACSSRVFVDAKPVADLNTSEKIIIYLLPGDHVLSAWPNGACGGGMSEVRATIREGGDLSFRIGYGSNGDFSINATAF